MAVIAPVDVIARKWATVTPLRTADYESGVRNPRGNWQAASLAAADAWKAGVTQAAAQGLFSKGVNRAGNARWQEGATGKGVTRWGPGVALAEERYREAFAPFREAISRVTLPPRRARRDPANLQRVNVVVQALIDAKARLAS